MIIGEAPGYHESQQGFPFVGKSGQLLQKSLIKVGVTPKDVYVANVIKHRPPNNRDPVAEELKACWPYLEEQIALVNPKLIICVGKVSATHLADRIDLRLPASGLRGRTFQFKNWPVRITWHPAYCLRNPHKIPELTTDLAKALEDARKI